MVLRSFDIDRCIGLKMADSDILARAMHQIGGITDLSGDDVDDQNQNTPSSYWQEDGMSFHQLLDADPEADDVDAVNAAQPCQPAESDPTTSALQSRPWRKSEVGPLLAAMQKRPVTYNITLKEYHNATINENAWASVAMELNRPASG